MTNGEDSDPKDTDVGHLQSRIAGLIVTVLSTMFVLCLIWLLYSHTQALKPLAQATFLPNELFKGCTTERCLELLVEQEIQRFRALRVESALLYRNEVQIATLVVGLATTVLGAVLIFDRVTSAGEETLEISKGERAKLVLATTFPGLVLCAFGTLVLLMNVHGTTSGKNPIQVWEGRVLSGAAIGVTDAFETPN